MCEIAGLQAECEQCCAKESKRELKKNIKYTSGSLEICQWKMNHYPNVQEFVKKHSKDLGENFTVKYKSGAPPKLRFENEDGDTDSIRIDNWKTQDMLAYVQVRNECVIVRSSRKVFMKKWQYASWRQREWCYSNLPVSLGLWTRAYVVELHESDVWRWVENIRWPLFVCRMELFCTLWWPIDMDTVIKNGSS